MAFHGHRSSFKNDPVSWGFFVIVIFIASFESPIMLFISLFHERETLALSCLRPFEKSFNKFGLLGAENKRVLLASRALVFGEQN